MTVDKLIAELVKIRDESGGDLQVCSTHGASGAVDPLSYPFVYDADDLVADVLGIDEGSKYVSIYSGN